MNEDLLQAILESAKQKIQNDYRTWSYHNLTHAEKTAEEVAALFDAERELRNEHNEDFPLQESDRQLLILTAYVHDVVQGLEGYGTNETASVKWILEELTGNEAVITRDERSMIEHAILGTTTKLIDNQIHQEVDQYHLKNDARSLLFSQLLADADLAALGMEWDTYLKNAKALFEEEKRQTDWNAYLKEQSSVLRHHHYHTEAARERYTHLRENAEKVESKLSNQLKSGQGSSIGNR